MKLLSAAVLASSSLAGASITSPIDLGEIAALAKIEPTDSIVQLRRKFITYFADYSSDYVQSHPESVASEYPYFNFIPMPQGSIIPDKSAVSFSGNCFTQNTASSVTQADGTQKVTITTTGEPTTEGCSDNYWFMTVTGIER